MLEALKALSAFKTLCGDGIADPAAEIPNGVWIIVAIVLIACAVTAGVLTGRNRAKKEEALKAKESEDKKA